jgi:3-isopropylmalate dehydrogenase
MTKKIVTLSGDGIGPEIMAAGLEVLDKVASKIGFDYDIDAKPFGGAGIDAEGHPLPKSTLDAAKSADAILLAAIGGPKYDNAPVRPEQGLLAIRKELNLFANIRPVRIFDALKHLSPLKPERIEGVDFVVVRELTGGIYFGEHILEEDKARDINDYSASCVVPSRLPKVVVRKSLALINKMSWQLLNCGVRLPMKFLWNFQM